MLIDKKNTQVLNTLQEYGQTSPLPEISVLGAAGSQDTQLKCNL